MANIDEDQIEAIKRWWNDYGLITIIVCAVLGAAFVGWNMYQNHQEQKAQEGSALYQRFIVAAEQLEEEALEGGTGPQVAELANQLITQYDGTLYADFAQLHLAKFALQEGDQKKALDLLKGVTDTGANEEIKTLARLRLGRVTAEQGDTEAAIALLGSEVPSAFASAYAEARGDVLLSEQRFAEARTAYLAAMESMADPRSPRRSLIQLKIDNTRTSSDDSGVLPSPHAPGPSPHGAPAPAEAAAGGN